LAMVAGVVRGGGRFLRRASWHLVLLIGVIGFFAVFLDALHDAVKLMHWKAHEILAFLEDGGELMAMSLPAGYAALLLARGGRPPSLRAIGGRLLRRVRLPRFRSEAQHDVPADLRPATA